MPAWSEKEESSFLRTIVQVKGLKVSGAEWEAISSLVEGDYSATACRLHFAKILKDGESDAGAATPDGSGATPSTTAGKKRKAATATTDGGKSPSKQPQKRQRKTAAKDKGKSKDEDEDDEDSPFVKKEIKDEESEALDSDEA